MEVGDIFGCCKRCKPPIRHPGCHSKCELYLNDKRRFEARKQLVEENKKRQSDRVTAPKHFKDHHPKRHRKENDWSNH